MAFFPPLAMLLALALYQGRRLLAGWTAFALMFSSTVAILHYINVWPRLLAYVNRAVASEQGIAMFGSQKTGWDYILAYLDDATHASLLIPIFLAALVLTIPYFITVIKRCIAASLKDWESTREAAKPVIVWWLLMVAYVVPTLAPTKNGFLHSFYACSLDRGSLFATCPI